MSSNAAQLIALVAYFVTIAARMSFNRCIVGTVSRAMIGDDVYSASIVEIAISVWIFDFHAIGQFEHFVSHPVQECT